jgi:hypothetical protein
MAGRKTARDVRRLAIATVVGVLEALLLARLLAWLLAARPDNPAVAWLDAVSAPLRWPLMMLDAAQPRFGSRLELSTLVMAAIVLLIGAIVWRLSDTSPAARLWGNK